MNVVQYWHGSEVPDAVQELINTWTAHNPEHQHHLFNCQSAAKFIAQHYGEALACAFRQITLPAMQCDVFRVAYLLIEGGLYVDVGFTCFKPIAEWGIEPQRMTLMRKWHGGVCNGLICAPAQHPWLKDLWQRIESVLINRQDGDVWSLTGPLLFIQITDREAKLEDFDSRYAIPGHNKHARSIHVLNQNDSTDLFTPCNALKHRTRAHWSKLQTVVPLFEERTYPFQVTSNTVAIDKHLTVYLAHSNSTRDSVLAKFKRDAAENNTATLQIPEAFFNTNLQQSDLEQRIKALLSDIQSVPHERVVLLLELTKYMSEPHYNKSAATLALNNLSYLISQFSQSSLSYAVSDQCAISSFHIAEIDGLPPAQFEGKINSLKACPALDFNLLDEAFRFFFPGCQLAPFFAADILPANDKNILDSVQYDELKTHFAESNLNLVEKHPHLESSFAPLSEQTLAA